MIAESDDDRQLSAAHEWTIIAGGVPGDQNQVRMA